MRLAGDRFERTVLRERTVSCSRSIVLPGLYCLAEMRFGDSLGSSEWPPAALALGGYSGFVMESKVAQIPPGPFLRSKPSEISRNTPGRTCPAASHGRRALKYLGKLGCEQRASRGKRTMFKKTEPFRILLCDAQPHLPDSLLC